VVEDDEDLDQFVSFVKANPVLAFDTETTGLDIYSNRFRVRLAQFGNANESWVLPVERSAKATWYAVNALRHAERLVIQNASFDLAVVKQCWGIPFSETFSKTVDTKILAKLIDSRSVKVGGIGESLEDLTAHYIDKTTADEVKSSMGNMAKRLRLSKGELFSSISSRDPEYLLYSGMDAVLTYRLWQRLEPLVPIQSRSLIEFEHEVQRVCTQVSDHGYLLDLEYTRKLSAKLRATETRSVNTARSLGVENVNSAEQVIDAFKARGWLDFSTTDKGSESADKHVLEAALGSRDKEVAKLAKAVSEAKRAGKWRATWVDTFLESVDADGYCHPSIRTLQARTGRMSITGIPAQTLPASEASIRHCFLAEAGHVTLSTDYQAQELRVLAALSRDEVMLQAFRDGKDLHQVTADAAGVSRKAGKGTNFAVVFGGGIRAIVEPFGVAPEEAAKALKAFKATYLGVKKFSAQAQRQACIQGYVVSPSGRRLLIDKERPYSATNALVQSTARDVTCRGLLRLDAAGYSPYIRLPIHDEVVFSVPAELEQEAASETNKLMQEEMVGLMISTEAEAQGRSWGSLYEDPGSNRKYVL